MKYLAFTTFIPRNFDHTTPIGVVELNIQATTRLIKSEQLAYSLLINTEQFSNIRYHFPVEYYTGLEDLLNDQIAVLSYDPRPKGGFVTTDSSSAVYCGSGYVQFIGTTPCTDLEYISKSSVKIADLLRHALKTVFTFSDGLFLTESSKE